MRERLCEVLEELRQDELAERYMVNKHSRVPLLNHLLRAPETGHQSAIAQGHQDSETRQN